MSMLLVGINHKTAPLEIRERVAYNQDEAREALMSLKAADGGIQAILLSTCNRTELYAMMRDPDQALPEVTERLFSSRGVPSRNGALYIHREEEVVSHLFRVACGLDSMVLGEQEILGQMKTAYEISRQAETVGTVFHRLANRAFHVGKRARAETRIGLGAMSMASAAVELTEKVLGSLEGKGVLLVGTGENGALCAQHLMTRNLGALVLANRTRSKAEELADRLGAQTVDLEQGMEMLSEVDVVVSTTGSPEPVIGAESVRRAMGLREGRALVLVDIALPRDVDPAVDEIPNVFRFDMDALDGIIQTNLDQRRSEVPSVETLVADEVTLFMRWWRSLEASPLIRDIHENFRHVRERELERNRKRFQPEDREQLEVFSQTLVRKLLTPLTTHIKKLDAQDPRSRETLASLREAFGLDDEKDGPL